MFVAITSALILLVIIKLLAGKEVSLARAVVAALVAGIVMGILRRPVLAAMAGLGVAAVDFVVVAAAVYGVCSAGLKRALMIAGTYIAVGFALYLLMFALLAFSGA